MSVPNQKMIKVKKELCNGKNYYATINLRSLQVAMIVLRNNDFKLWCYMAKNQNNYGFELSPSACAKWGMKSDAYYNAVKSLIRKAYLVPIRENSNIYIFHELPEAYKDMVISNSESDVNTMKKYDFRNCTVDEIMKHEMVNWEAEDPNSEKPKLDSDNPKLISEKLEANSENPKIFPEKPERNNTNNTKILQNNIINYSNQIEKQMLEKTDRYSSGTPVSDEIISKRIDEMYDILQKHYGFPGDENLKAIQHLIEEDYYSPWMAVITVMEPFKEGDM